MAVETIETHRVLVKLQQIKTKSQKQIHDIGDRHFLVNGSKRLSNKMVFGDFYQDDPVILEINRDALQLQNQKRENKKQDRQQETRQGRNQIHKRNAL